MLFSRVLAYLRVRVFAPESSRGRGKGRVGQIGLQEKTSEGRTEAGAELPKDVLYVGSDRGALR